MLLVVVVVTEGWFITLTQTNEYLMNSVEECETVAEIIHQTTPNTVAYCKGE